MNKLLLTCACATALAFYAPQTVNAQDYLVQISKISLSQTLSMVMSRMPLAVSSMYHQMVNMQ